VHDRELLSSSLCSLLASSTRHLIGHLDGEQNAQFISDMAPFNVNFWLVDADSKSVVSEKYPENLAKLCDGILALEHVAEMSDRENAHAVKRALANLLKH